MSDTTMDPKAIAQAVAVTVSDEDGQVGDFVEAIDLGDNVTDFRFESRVRGYEGWQWSVTLYHDVELDHWTVNESSLVPTDKALRPPKWIPWKDRLEPGDLAVTDSIGTDPDDPRMEEGFRKTQDAETSDDTDDKPSVADETVQEPAMDGNASDESEKTDVSEDSEQPVTSEEDVEEAVEEFDPVPQARVDSAWPVADRKTLVRRPTWAKIAIHQDGRRQSLLHMRILHSAEG